MRMMMAGASVHCIGRKDGVLKQYFIYQPFNNQESMKKWGSQAVVVQPASGRP